MRAAAAVRAAMAAADRSLRRPAPTPDASDRSIATLLVAIVLMSPVYGAAMGSYGFGDPERRFITLYAAIKTPMLLLVTTTLCLAPFLVLGYVARLQDELRSALAAILTGQACAACVLAAAAPVTLVMYTAIADHDLAILYNALVFGLAALAGHRATLLRFAPLIRRRPRYRPLLWFWCVLYCFVGIQLGWTLRPFVGSPGSGAAFFREESFTNAYLQILRIAASAAGL